MSENANQIPFNDIFIGQKEIFSKKITESMLDEFSKFSGDLNPLHMNDEYADSSIFGKRIVHGMLLSTFFSQLIGMKLPGKNSLYFSQSLNFRSPCYIDNEIQVIGEVTEKSNSTRIITISTSILNESGTCLIDGVAKVIVR